MVLVIATTYFRSRLVIILQNFSDVDIFRLHEKICHTDDKYVSYFFQPLRIILEHIDWNFHTEGPKVVPLRFFGLI